MRLPRRFADAEARAAPLARVVDAAPPRRLVASRGRQTVVTSTSHGAIGRVSDRSWPAMPAAFRRPACEAAAAVGSGPFEPDARLGDRRAPGIGTEAHRDRGEDDLGAPIAPVSLGPPARLVVVGPERRGRSTSIDLVDGDVVAFCRPARLHRHGVRPPGPDTRRRFGPARWNPTFRQVRVG